MHIVFSKKGKAVSYYEIEQFYQDNKHKSSICIANECILARFRVGVKEGDIPPFKITVKDLDNTLYQEICSTDGNLCITWDSKILKVYDSLIMRAL